MLACDQKKFEIPSDQGNLQEERLTTDLVISPRTELTTDPGEIAVNSPETARVNHGDEPSRKGRTNHPRARSFCIP
jgi:hypothetical protein